MHPPAPLQTERGAGRDQCDGRCSATAKSIFPSGQKPLEPLPCLLVCNFGIGNWLSPRLLGTEGARDEAPVSNAGAQENPRIGASCLGRDGLAGVCSLGPCLP